LRSVGWLIIWKRVSEMYPPSHQSLLVSMLQRAADSTLADIGEKALLADFLLPMCRTICGDRGLGDDVGILSVPAGNAVAVTTDRIPSDLLARQLGLMTPADIGGYLVRVNVSDLAAAGADPLAMVVTAAFRPAEKTAYVVEVMWGAYVESARLGCPVVGGDTKAAAEESLSATALGSGPSGKAVRRGPVRPGMRVYLSGPVGHAGVALRWFMGKRAYGKDVGQPFETSLVDTEMREYLVRPVPRIDLVKALRESECPCAMDITDGLGQSLLEIARPHSVDIELNFDKLRVNPTISMVMETLGLDLHEVLGGIGLDLELIAIGDQCHMPQGFYEVGRLISGNGNISFADGRKMVIRGYEHFSRTPKEFLEQAPG